MTAILIAAAIVIGLPSLVYCILVAWWVLTGNKKVGRIVWSVVDFLNGTR